MRPPDQRVAPAHDSCRCRARGARWWPLVRPRGGVRDVRVLERPDGQQVAPDTSGVSAPACRAGEGRARPARRTPATARDQGYRRDAFGSDWVDTDHNGCNQRDDVLLRDAVPGTTTVARQGACDHDVLAGTWHDPYTGRTLTVHRPQGPQPGRGDPDRPRRAAGRGVGVGGAALEPDAARGLRQRPRRAARGRRPDQHEQGGRRPRLVAAPRRATSASTRGAGSRSRPATAWRSTDPRRRPSTRCSALCRRTL